VGFNVVAIFTRSVREYLIAFFCCRSSDRLGYTGFVAPHLNVILGYAVVNHRTPHLFRSLPRYRLKHVQRASLVYLVFAVFYLLFPVIFSDIVREYVAIVLCCRSRDSLNYTFHFTLSEAMLRLRTEPHLKVSAALQVPPCFLPREEDGNLSLVKRASSVLQSVRPRTLRLERTRLPRISEAAQQQV
jgi:hypothetical protein